MGSGAPERGGRSGPVDSHAECAHGADLAGRYRVGSLLRTDGRCCVHEGRDDLLRRAVSVTLATPERGIPIPSTLPLPTSARHLHGPGLGEIYDGGDDHGTLYLITQAPVGATLADELTRHHLSADEVRDLGAGIARALLPAHRHGWAHGALEAGTVALGPDRVTVAGLGVGEWLAHWAHLEDRPRHPAPEQLADREISPATDVFALGALLTEASEPLPPTDPLALLLCRMRADDPAERPSTQEVLSLLRAPDTTPPRVDVVRREEPDRQPDGRTAPTVAALGGLAVAAALALATFVVHPSDASPERVVGGATVAAWSAHPVLPGPLPLLIPPIAREAMVAERTRAAAVTVEAPRTATPEVTVEAPRTATSDVRVASPPPHPSTRDDASAAPAPSRATAARTTADRGPTDTSADDGTTDPTTAKHVGTTIPTRSRATSPPVRVDRTPTTPAGHGALGDPMTTRRPVPTTHRRPAGNTAPAPTSEVVPTRTAVRAATVPPTVTVTPTADPDGSG